MSSTVGAACLVVCALVVPSPPVSAQGAAASRDERHDHEARTLFHAATMAYQDGRFEDALDLFRRAHALSGRASLLFNMASAAERLRLEEQAIEAYEQYLEAVPDAENREFVESRIGLLRKQVARESEPPMDGPDPEGTSVPTPKEAAVQVDLAQGSADGPLTETRPVTRRWWFWTAIGGTVALGILATVLFTSRGGSATYPDDSIGGTVFTLGRGAP